MKFPHDIPIRKAIKILENLGFKTLRTGNHISMIRENADGSKTPLTIPNHPKIRGSTFRTILTQSGIARNDFMKEFEK